jgi:hypothetical protein
MGGLGGQRDNVVFIGEPRDCVFRLGLQIRRLMAPDAAARNCGIRPRFSKLATRDVMNTVLPARLNPVTPKRITGSVNGAVTVSVTAPTLRVMPSAKVVITNCPSLSTS